MSEVASVEAEWHMNRKTVVAKRQSPQIACRPRRLEAKADLTQMVKLRSTWKYAEHTESTSETNRRQDRRYYLNCGAAQRSWAMKARNSRRTSASLERKM